MPGWKKAFLSGLAGALALNLLHEIARHVLPAAPRVDVIGERAVVRVSHMAGIAPPRGTTLYLTALAGDVLMNTAQFAVVAPFDAEPATDTRGIFIGAVGGLIALLLPPILGLGRQPGRKTPITQTMTLAWYLFGGLVAARTHRVLSG